MLFSRGDYLRTLSAILSEKGLDEGEKDQSPLVSFRSLAGQTLKFQVKAVVL
jgi:hypothetical protein